MPFSLYDGEIYRDVLRVLRVAKLFICHSPSFQSFAVNWLKFISRCDWLIIFGRVFIYFCILFCFLLFFLLFIQIVYLWILTLHIKVSNFLVDILKIQVNKFLKINKVVNKTFVVPIVSPDVYVLISTRFYYIWCTVDKMIPLSLFIWSFSLLVFLKVHSHVWDNFLQLESL